MANDKQFIPDILKHSVTECHERKCAVHIFSTDFRLQLILFKMSYLLLVANFRRDPVDKLKFFCLIESCKKEVLTSKSNKSSNLKRHLEKNHAELYEKTLFGLAEYEVQRLKLLQACVELVTINGRPLIALEDSGFQKSIAFQLNHLAQHGCKLLVSRSTIKPYIERTAVSLREKLKAELKNRTLSIMTDIVTKNHRGILGINAQYYSEGKIHLRTLGMVQMHVRHNAENIRDLIVECLRSYAISMDQVYSYTSDNAANMIASHDRMRIAAIDSTEEESTTMNENDFDLEFSGSFTKTVRALAELINEYSALQLPSITGIGCAAHILQTIIFDALKGTEDKVLINKVRAIVITLRGQVYMIELGARGAKLPIIDSLTRWNSIYFMVSSPRHPHF